MSLVSAQQNYLFNNVENSAVRALPRSCVCFKERGRLGEFVLSCFMAIYIEEYKT